MKHDFQHKEDAIKTAEERTGVKFDLLPCPHCGHSANLTDPEKDPDCWGGYEWAIRVLQFALSGARHNGCRWMV